MKVDWEGLAKANTHPLRVSIIELMSGDRRKRSPKELSAELREPLSNVNYHVTALADAGLLELAGERQVRGAVEHFYRAVNGRPKRRAAKRQPARKKPAKQKPAAKQQAAGRKGKSPSKGRKKRAKS